MANFIGMVYGTLKAKGIDTSKMSTEEAIAKFNEINKEEGGGNRPVKADSPNAPKEVKEYNAKVDKENAEKAEMYKKDKGLANVTKESLKERLNSDPEFRKEFESVFGKVSDEKLKETSEETPKQKELSQENYDKKSNHLISLISDVRREQEDILAEYDTETDKKANDKVTSLGIRGSQLEKELQELNQQAKEQGLKVDERRAPMFETRAEIIESVQKTETPNKSQNQQLMDVVNTLNKTGTATTTNETIAKQYQANKNPNFDFKVTKVDGGWEINATKKSEENLNKEYVDALKTAKTKVEKEEKETQKRSARILESVRQKNAGIQKYEQQNEQWKAKVQESYRLAAEGKLKEADKVYEEGRKIYESIPKEFRKK